MHSNVSWRALCLHLQISFPEIQIKLFEYFELKFKYFSWPFRKPNIDYGTGNDCSIVCLFLFLLNLECQPGHSILDILFGSVVTFSATCAWYLTVERKRGWAGYCGIRVNSVQDVLTVCSTRQRLLAVLDSKSTDLNLKPEEEKEDEQENLADRKLAENDFFSRFA